VEGISGADEFHELLQRSYGTCRILERAYITNRGDSTGRGTGTATGGNTTTTTNSTTAADAATIGTANSADSAGRTQPVIIMSTNELFLVIKQDTVLGSSHCDGVGVFVAQDGAQGRE
jgi:hypothetical protein